MRVIRGQPVGELADRVSKHAWASCGDTCIHPEGFHGELECIHPCCQPRWQCRESTRGKRRRSCNERHAAGRDMPAARASWTKVFSVAASIVQRAEESWGFFCARVHDQLVSFHDGSTADVWVL